jgi:hypothetical protein
MLAPVIKVMTEGKIAGKLAFEVIDHKPIVNANQEGTQKITHAT